jgi:hypothetical protein
MRLFTPSNGNQVDLDDFKTYENLPQTVKELRHLMLAEIGYYHCYVNYLYPGFFDSQKPKIERLIKEFTINERANYDNVMWYQEQVFIFQDEIENMC